MLNALFHDPSFMNGLVGAVIGGLLTGFFTLYATDKTISAENAKEVKRDEKEVLNLLASIRVEISTLWDFHMQRIGAMVENLQDGQAFEFYYPLTQDYFTVYNSNATMLGKVQNDELRKAIVVCYNKCKKVVDGFKYNNELFRDWRDTMDMPDITSMQGRAAAKFQALQNYAAVIKMDHFEVKSYVEQLLHLIDANVERSA